MIRRVFACSLFGLLGVAALGTAPTHATPQENPDPAKMDVEALRDTWNFVFVEKAGEKQARVKRGEDYRTIAFDGDKFTIKQGEALIQSGTCKLDATQKPKTVDFTITEGAGKGTVQLGIYELTGDSFKLCLDSAGKKRPSEFKSTPESGLVLSDLQRERKAGIDPKDTSVVYDEPWRMNSGFKAYNGKAYDMVALSVDPKQTVVVPDRATVVQRHDLADVVLVYMEKRANIRAHFVRSTSITDYRTRLGCAVKFEKGSLLIGTFGEFGFLEGAVGMKLLVIAPKKLEVKERAGLIGGYGGRAGATRPENAINPTRDDPKPPLKDSKEGTPPRWLPPTKEDGWHEIPSAPDIERRVSKVEKLQPIEKKVVKKKDLP